LSFEELIAIFSLFYHSNATQKLEGRRLSLEFLPLLCLTFFFPVALQIVKAIPTPSSSASFASTSPSSSSSSPSTSGSFDPLEQVDTENIILSHGELVKCFTIMYIITTKNPRPDLGTSGINDLVEVVLYKAQLVTIREQGLPFPESLSTLAKKSLDKEGVGLTLTADGVSQSISVKHLMTLMQEGDFLETFWESFIPNKTNTNSQGQGGTRAFPALDKRKNTDEWVFV
jgi:hypothetical protein